MQISNNKNHSKVGFQACQVYAAPKEVMKTVKRSLQDIEKAAPFSVIVEDVTDFRKINPNLSQLTSKAGHDDEVILLLTNEHAQKANDFEHGWSTVKNWANNAKQAYFVSEQNLRQTLTAIKEMVLAGK